MWHNKADLSFSGMPSNSSMQHTPPSASTSAPASSAHPPPSCTAAAVRPTADEARPLVTTEREASFATYFWNWLFPADRVLQVGWEKGENNVC